MFVAFDELRLVVSRKRVMLACAAISVVWLCAHDGHAQVYKWVDERGLTQYSSTPPPGKGQKVIPAPVPGAADTMTPKPKPLSVQEQEIEFRVRRAEAEEKQRKEEEARNAMQRRSAEKRESCIQAREDLQALTEQRPIYSLNERGERVYVSDKDRPQWMESAKRTIARDCPA